ncbi:hypothetical protein [Ktedonospora formicarum]|uniref:Uncharacterized protein n=1 Tax=Ktedonospora formicarum TaxID=2778364 RepID=A0A8J3HXJ3_9CHLR|nr:hypothetical protein [Ktedonospora formicarum]GHO42915.1 hypothetical protein KSX_10780 [Ktedonospora formicarum]
MSDFEKDDCLSKDEVKFTDLELPKRGLRFRVLASGQHIFRIARYPAVRGATLVVLAALLLFIFLPDLVAISQLLFNNHTSQVQQATDTQPCSLSVIIVSSPGPFNGAHYWRKGVQKKTAQGSECIEKTDTHTCTVSGGTVNEVSTNIDDGTWQVVNLAGTPQAVKCR